MTEGRAGVPGGHTTGWHWLPQGHQLIDYLGRSGTEPSQIERRSRIGLACGFQPSSFSCGRASGSGALCQCAVLHGPPIPQRSSATVMTAGPERPGVKIVSRKRSLLLGLWRRSEVSRASRIGREGAEIAPLQNIRQPPTTHAIRLAICWTGYTQRSCKDGVSQAVYSACQGNLPWQ